MCPFLSGQGGRERLHTGELGRGVVTEVSLGEARWLLRLGAGPLSSAAQNWSKQPEEDSQLPRQPDHRPSCYLAIPLDPSSPPRYTLCFSQCSSHTLSPLCYASKITRFLWKTEIQDVGKEKTFSKCRWEDAVWMTSSHWWLEREGWDRGQGEEGHGVANSKAGISGSLFAHWFQKPWKLSKIRGESLFPFPFPFLPLPVSFRRSYHRNLPLSPSGSYPVGTGLLSFIHSFHTHHFVPNYGSGVVLGSEAVKLKTDIISVLLELKVFSRGDWQKQADSQNNWKLE